MQPPTEIVIPKETVSDDIYKVVAVHCQNGDSVKPGKVLAEIETSKATFEVEAPVAGRVFVLEPGKDEITPGAVFAVIGDETFDFAAWKKKTAATTQTPGPSSNPAPAAAPSTPAAKPSMAQQAPPAAPVPSQASEAPAGSVRIAKPAHALMQEHGVARSDFPPSLGLITSSDVQSVIQSRSSSVRPLEPNSIVVVGGGGHTKVCIDLIRRSGQFKLVGIIYTKFSPGPDILGYPVLGGMDLLPALRQRGLQHLAIGIGGLRVLDEREILYGKLTAMGFFLPALIHPQAMIEPSAQIGAGCQIMAGAVIGSDVQIGENTIVNSSAVVSHDSTVGRHTHIAPGALIAGGVVIGDTSLIGMGVTVVWRATIGSHVIINNGCHIHKPVPDGAVIKA